MDMYGDYQPDAQPDGPTGIPDPQNPGYDTGGYPLPSARTGPPAPTHGGIIDPGTGDMTVGQPTAMPTPLAPAPTNWGGLSQSIFGSMPSVGVATPPPFEYDPFQAPAAFAPPSAQDVLFSDPGFQFRLDQGTGAMQNSAAARGTLNTGGTLQDLVDYGQKAASQEYGGAFNRALGTYDENYKNSLNSYITNFGNALTKYNTNYGTQYLTPYNQLMGQYQQGVGNQGQLFNQQFQTATA